MNTQQKLIKERKKLQQKLTNYRAIEVDILAEIEILDYKIANPQPVKEEFFTVAELYKERYTQFISNDEIAKHYHMCTRSMNVIVKLGALLVGLKSAKIAKSKHIRGLF